MPSMKLGGGRSPSDATILGDMDTSPHIASPVHARQHQAPFQAQTRPDRSPKNMV